MCFVIYILLLDLVLSLYLLYIHFCMILSLIYLFLLVDLTSKLYIYIIFCMCFVIYILLVDLLLSLSIYTHKSIIYIFLHVPVTRSRALSWRDSLLLDARAAKLSLDIIYLNSYVHTFKIFFLYFCRIYQQQQHPALPHVMNIQTHWKI